MKKSAAFSLLEVMITLVLISIGALSLGYFHLEAMASSYQSQQYEDAELLMEEIASTLIANRELLDDPSKPYQKSNGESITPADPETNCETEDCSLSAISNVTLASWKQAISQKLPVDDAILKDEIYICRDQNPSDTTLCDGNGDSFVINLSWKDNTDPEQRLSSSLVLIP